MKLSPVRVTLMERSIRMLEYDTKCFHPYLTMRVR